MVHGWILSSAIATASIATSVMPAAAQHWQTVFASSPETLDLARDLPPRLAMLRPAARLSGTLQFRVPHVVADGRLVIRISNEAGDVPLRIAAASIARTSGSAAGARPVPIVFGGRSSIIVPAGAPALSDPVALPAGSNGTITVSIYVPDGLALNPAGGAAMMFAPGDQVARVVLDDAKPIFGRPFVSAVYAENGTTTTTAIVTFGDSITDANRYDGSVYTGWTETLRRRLVADPRRRGFTVVNAGISGNRVLNDGLGAAALARFDRDALSVPGVRYVVLLEGINDIGHADRSEVFAAAPPVIAADLIGGYRQIIARAHAKGIRVILGTLLPFAGADVATPAREALRTAVNNWIRRQRESDGVIDFERAVCDPARLATLRANFDSGDHLHPNADGYRAMGEAIDLRLFGDTQADENQ